MSILGKSVLIVALAAGLLTQFFTCCAFAIRSFSKVSATPELHFHYWPSEIRAFEDREL